MHNIQKKRMPRLPCDRRKRKTRQAILEACLAFIDEHGILTPLTVNDIVKRAGINRGACCLPFRYKYDLS